MRQERNIKSEREEIAIILPEHGKGRSQAEKRKFIEDSSEHGKGGSQAEKRRIIEDSFRNAISIKSSLFRKKYRRFFDYALFGKASEISRNIEERYFGRHLPATACLFPVHFTRPFFPGHPMPGKFMSPRRTAASSASAAFW